MQIALHKMTIRIPNLQGTLLSQVGEEAPFSFSNEGALSMDAGLPVGTLSVLRGEQVFCSPCRALGGRIQEAGGVVEDLKTDMQ